MTFLAGLSGRRLAVFALPLAFLLISVVLRADRGPYWQSRFLDPDYVYLFSALNVAQLIAPLHNDHPGLTVQVPGGVLLRAVEAADKVRGTARANLAESVIVDPERYLRLLSSAFLAAAALSGALAGVVALQIGLPLLSALAVQSSWLLTPIVLSHGIRVAPEAAFVVLLPWLGLLLLWYGQRTAAQWSARASMSTGALLGLLVATKITALPWLVLVLLPGTLKGALQIAAWAAATVAVISIPIYSRAFHVRDWLMSLLTHKGMYGSGSSGFVDLQVAASALKEYSTKEAALFAVAMLSVLALSHHVVLARRKTGVRTTDHASANRWARALLVATLAMWGSILMVAKHPGQHYLLPASGVVAAVLALLFQKPAHGLSGHLWRRSAVVLFSLLALRTIQLRAQEAANDREYRVQTERLVRSVAAADSSCVRIYYYSASSPEYALSFANDFAGRAYSNSLRALRVGQQWTYNVWLGEFASGGTPLPLDTIGRVTCVVVQGTPRSDGASIESDDRASMTLPDPGLRAVIAAHTNDSSSAKQRMRFEVLSAPRREEMAWLVRLR